MTATSSVKVLARAARSCTAEADRAEQLGQYRYAAELRQSARNRTGRTPRHYTANAGRPRGGATTSASAGDCGDAADRFALMKTGRW
jgi:hypothetical protein